MRILTIDSNGGVVASRDLNVTIAKYIERFDDEHPIINITNAEYAQLQDEGTKSSILDKMRKYVVYDYCCFLKTQASSKLEMFLHGLTEINYIDHKVFTGTFNVSDKTTIEDDVTMLIEKYTSERNSESTCADIMVLAYKMLMTFLKQYTAPFPINENEETNLNECINSRHKNTGLPLRITQMFDNGDIRLDRYGSMEIYMNNAFIVMAFWLPVFWRKLYRYIIRSNVKNAPSKRRLLNLIKPFTVTKHFSFSPFTFDKDIFVERILNSLVSIKEIKRSELYCLIQLHNFFSSRITAIDRTNMLYSLKRTIVDFPQMYKLTLSSPHNKKELIEFGITDLLDIRCGGETNKEFASILQSYYKEYEDSQSSLWENLAEQDAFLFFKTNPLMNNSWLTYYYERIHSHRKGNYILPPSCFYLIISRNIIVGQMITLSKSLVADFVDLLVSNKCDNQESFHEEMYILNYILKKVKAENIDVTFVEKDSVVNDILHFLEPILNTNFLNLKVISLSGFKRMISKIVRNALFYDIIKEPKGISNNIGVHFNVSLVCNIIGQLSKTRCFRYTDSDNNTTTLPIPFFVNSVSSDISNKLLPDEFNKQRQTIRKQITLSPSNEDFVDEMRILINKCAIDCFKEEREGKYHNYSK